MAARGAPALRSGLLRGRGGGRGLSPRGEASRSPPVRGACGKGMWASGPFRSVPGLLRRKLERGKNRLEERKGLGT